MADQPIPSLTSLVLLRMPQVLLEIDEVFFIFR